MAEKKRKTASPPPAYASAVDKIRDEMAKGKGRYVQVVGEYLTDYLLGHTEAEAAILDSKKSIAGSLEEMKKEARKEAVNGCGVLDDQTAFGIVLKYFGIKGEATEGTSSGTADAAQSVPKNRTESAQTSAKEPDLFDLDALMSAL